MSLARYGIDPVTGFVPGNPPLRALPGAFAVLDAIVPEVSGLLRARRMRSALLGLPTLDVRELSTPAERERAMLLLCHFANAWVYGGAEPHLRIPAVVAVPLCALAELLGRPPIAHYATMTLANWQLLDPSAPLSVDNARTQVQFLGGVDEDWFFIASMGVELAGAPLLHLVGEAERLAREGSDDELTAALERFVQGMPAVHRALQRVREWCDPHTYYLRVRPYVSSWPKPGVVYEGVSDAPRLYLGGSAAQSALIQSFDVLLGVAHPHAPAGAYLRTVRAYMPPLHRAFVEHIERTSQVRARAERGSAALASAYNAALAQLELFREAHLQLAHDYIIRPSGAETDATGTGGTALRAFLAGAHADTTGTKL
jgi:indoleamine 2,3-dioxygenase